MNPYTLEILAKERRRDLQRKASNYRLAKDVQTKIQHNGLERLGDFGKSLSRIVCNSRDQIIAVCDRLDSTNRLDHIGGQQQTRVRHR